MSFTPEAVLLEQRQGLGWRPLGQAPFASGGMKATLQALIDDSGAAPEDSATLLVIPDDQILYTSLSIPFGSDTPLAIGRALEAMTPYRAEDLVFDWCPAINGDIETLRVAAVARRTLEEADDFARSQGFIPSGFIARPEDDRFDGQPDFGASLYLPEPATRQPFSEPDLSLAGITAPTIPADPTDAPQKVTAVAPTISRIPPHIVLDQPSPRPVIKAASPERPQTPAPDATVAPPVAVIEDELEDLPMPVFRYDENGEVQAPGPMPHLPPRAQAFHARAQHARIQREHPAEAEASTPDAKAASRGRFMPGPLGKVAGGLFLAIFLVMAIFGGTPEKGTTPAPEQTAQIPEPSGQVAAERPAAIDPVQPSAQLPETGMAGEATQPATTPAADPAATAETAPAPDDSLTRALAEAMAEPADRPEAPTRSISAATLSAEDLATAPMGTSRDTTTADRPAQAQEVQTQPPAVAAVPAALARSARPPRSAPEKAAAPAAPDSRPQVPGNPLPFDRRDQVEPNPVTGIRPPSRPRSPAAEEATAPAATQSPATRPQSRPQQLGFLEEGSRREDDQPTRLSHSEEARILQILRDLRTAQAGQQGLSKPERKAMMLLADARPTRKPVSVSGPSQKAVRDALAQAVESDDRPTARAKGTGSTALAQSARPTSKPRGAAAKSSASLSQAAVENAIASAVSASTAMPGAVALTALTSSALPPRRAAAAIGNAVMAAAPSAAPSAGDLRAAAQAQTAEREAALAEQRRIDSELQAQAEARARAFAAQDAAAEARARAQAEARARAQAEAEARSAAASKRNYTPPEAENEPEVAASSVPDGRIATTAAATATVKDGIQISRTQIIGTIGAGKASRALVRLSNGKVITLRLGDKINGGTISEIGNSQISFVKGGRTQQLSVLNGQ